MFKKRFKKNLSYMMISNILSLLFSALLLLLLPKYLSNEVYGYIQLYIFSTYLISFLTFGISEGNYLRNAGKNYSEINFKDVKFQYVCLVVINVVISIILYSVVLNYIYDKDRLLVVGATLIASIIIVPRSILSMTLTTTDRIQEYSKTYLLERTLNFVIVITFLLIGKLTIELVLFFDIFAKLASLLLTIWYSKKVFLSKIEITTRSFKELLENIRVGLSLLFSNAANFFIIGGNRLLIERKWGIVIFGEISLTLSLINMYMLLLNSIGMSLFPSIKTASLEQQNKFVIKIQNLSMVLTLPILLTFFLMSFFLSIWLPSFENSIIFLAILYPLILIEFKVTLLFSNIIKALRKEKFLFKTNLLCLLLSMCIGIISMIVFNNVYLVIGSITLSLLLRYIILSVFVMNKLHLKSIRYVLFDLFFITLFLIISLNVS